MNYEIMSLYVNWNWKHWFTYFKFCSFKTNHI